MSYNINSNINNNFKNKNKNKNRRIALKIAYDGTDYSGWQRQPDVISVQEVVESQLKRVSSDCTHVVASGRTDAGVHSLGQVVHFDTDSKMPADKYCIALNCLLPDDIRIIKSWEVSSDFHARYSPINKEYRYTIRNSETAHALQGRFEWHISQKLDLIKMQEAARKFLGEHDFNNFTKTSCVIENRVRTILRSEIVVCDDVIQYYVKGTGFLYNMVRIMVGTLASVGRNKMPVYIIDELLANYSERDAWATAAKAGSTAPANGLTLLEVNY